MPKTKPSTKVVFKSLLESLKEDILSIVYEREIRQDSFYVSLLALFCFILVIPVFQNGLFGLGSLAFELPSFEITVRGAKYSVDMSDWTFNRFVMPLPFGIAVGSAIVFLVFWTRRWRFLFGLAPFFFLLLPHFYNVGYIDHGYAFSALIMIGILIWRGPFFSNPFLSGIAVFAAESVFTIIGFYPRFYSWLFETYEVVPTNVFTSLAIVIFLRFLVRVYQDNIDDLKLEKDGKLKKVFIETYRLWYPVLAIFVVFTAINVGVRYFYINPLVIEKIDLSTIATEIDQSLVSADRPTYNMRRELVEARVNDVVYAELADDKRSKSIDGALQSHVDASVAHFQTTTREKMNKFKSMASSNLNSAADYAKTKFPRRFPGTETQSCKLFMPDIGCMIMNGAKSIINSGYVSARANMIAEIRSTVDSLEGTAEEKFKEMEKQVVAITDDFGNRVNHSIIQVAQGIKLSGILLQIYAFVVLIKSFLVVAARVKFRDQAIAADPEFSRAVPGVISNKTKNANRIRLTRTGPKQLYFIESTLAANVVDRLRFPQPLTSILIRLRMKRYAFNLIDFDDKKQSTGCVVQVDQPGEIVKWQIKGDREVFLDLQNLIGFSKGCQIRRRISFRMSSLIFGRFIFRCVKGPGTLYLKTDEIAYRGNSTEAQSIMPPSSLIAWSSNCQFNVAAALTKKDVFLSGYKIQKIKRDNHLAVYDSAEGRRESAGTGVWRFARAFVLPF